MMSDMSGRDIVDRLPVVISGLGVDQLLCVPKIATGTGENIVTSVSSVSKIFERGGPGNSEKLRLMKAKIKTFQPNTKFVFLFKLR